MRNPFTTEGLVQIAIVLSLLRTDLNSYFRHNYVEYPEVQEIVLGQGVAYTRTNFHNLYNTYEGQPEILRKDVIENDYTWTSPIFRDLRSFRHLGNLQPVDIPTYLLVQGAVPLSLEPPQNQETDENANNIDPEPASTAPGDTDGVNILDSINFEHEHFSEIDPVLSSLLTPASDPTTEDLDLIEVLWRQDIDLGAGKEAYDLNLRQELEREREVELQKDKQKQKEAELQQKKLDDLQRQNQQRWLADNFTQDGETGEWVPLGARVPPTPPDPELLPDGDQPFLSTFDNVPMLSEQYCQEQPNHGFNNMGGSSQMGAHLQHQQQQQHQNPYQQVPQSMPQQLQQQQQQQQQAPPMYTSQHQHQINNHHHQQHQQQHQIQQQQQQQQQSGYQQFNISANPQSSYNRTSQMSNFSQNQINPQPAYTEQIQPFRQNSVEQAWQDLVNVLDLPQANQSMTASQQGQTNTSMIMVNQGLQLPLDNSSSVLIQNATLPTLPMNNNNLTGFSDSGLGSPSHNSTDIMHSPCSSNDVMSPAQSCNSTLGNNGSSLNPMEWGSPGYLFSNITNNLNQTESLEDVDELLPELITEDELDDIAFDELGLGDGMTPVPPGNNDDASSDSAVSMGSPHTDFSDVMSPLDDTVEGATGGEGYQSSSSFSKTSKYDPDDYKYSNSCSYGYGDTSSNFSCSSNDTDNSGHFNPTKNGNINNMNRNINHNHTYPHTPGKDPKDMRKSLYSHERSRHKGPHCRDAKRVEELSIPLTVDQIVESPVEEFNDILARHKLSEPQLQLIRDIRRRGKNKVAAQNCRKRKMDVIGTLEDEMTGLERMRDKLLHERQLIDKHTRDTKEKFGLLYTEIFQSLRDEHGRPYDPNRFSLQQSSDGDVFLVPRNFTSDDDANKKRKNERKYD